MTSLVPDTVDTTEGSVTTTDESVTEVTTTESDTDTTNTSGMHKYLVCLEYILYNVFSGFTNFTFSLDENFVDPREHEVEYEEQCHSNQVTKHQKFLLILKS